MPEILSIVPPRARAGQLIQINGAGFDPFGESTIEIGGVSVQDVVSRTETTIVCLIPEGVASNYWVDVVVFGPTQVPVSSRLWSQATGVELLSGEGVIAQIPGLAERQDLTRTSNPATPMAAYYMQLVSLWHYLHIDLMPESGDMIVSDDDGAIGLAHGSIGEQLENSGGSLGWGKFEVATLAWSERILAGNNDLGAMVPWGNPGVTQAGTVGMPLPILGNVLSRVSWYVQSSVGADTLDRVRVFAPDLVYDSGTGLGITQGSTFQFSGTENVLSPNFCLMEVCKIGTEGVMQVLAYMRIRDERP